MDQDKKLYNKLVCDKIPEIIKSSWKKFKIINTDKKKKYNKVV